MQSTVGIDPAQLPTGESDPIGHRVGLLIVFRVNDPVGSDPQLYYSFALSASQVLEIAHPLPLLKVPASPPFVQGLVNWRNRPVPVVDLAARFGISTSQDTESLRLLVTRTSRQELVGFNVNAQIRMLRLPIKAVPSRLPEGILPEGNPTDGNPVEIVRATFLTDVGLLVIPDVDRLIEEP